LNDSTIESWTLVNCSEYIEQYLSADADDELSVAERQLVEQHLRDCAECRARRAEERAVKASIRHHLGIVRTPADVRLRIRAALGELAERESLRPSLIERARVLPAPGSRRRASRTLVERRGPALISTDDAALRREGSVRRWLATQLRRATYLAPVGFVIILLAGATVLFRAAFNGTSEEAARGYWHPVPSFDFAIDRFNQLSQSFSPNVPAEAFSRDNGAYFAWVEGSDQIHQVSDDLPDISSSYEKSQMQPEFCDFAMAGYQLVGGRVDRLPDGAPVTYTLYRNPDNSILSIGLKQKTMDVPQGGYWFETHAFYSYRGYSLCLTVYPVGHFVSLIVTRAPLIELLRAVAAADIAFVER
jgi:hypothetical protein